MGANHECFILAAVIITATSNAVQTHYSSIAGINGLFLSVTCLVLVGVIVKLIVCPTNEGNDNTDCKSIFRTDTSTWGSTYLCAFLVPVSVVLTVAQTTLAESQAESAHHQFLFASCLLLTSLLLIRTNNRSSYPVDEQSSHADREIVLPTPRQTILSTVYNTAPLGLAVVVVGSFIYGSDYASTVLQCLGVLGLCVVQTGLPLWSVQTFNMGEAVILAQGTVYFLGCTIHDVTHKLCGLFSNTVGEYDKSGAVYYMEVAVLSCVLVVFLLFTVQPRWPILGFYFTLFTVMGVVAHPLLYALLNRNFLMWTLNYVTATETKIYLFIYWAVCCLLASLIVFATSHFYPTSFTSSPSTSIPADCDDANNTTSSRVEQSLSGDSGVKTSVRKLFHVLAVAIFVPGILLEPVMTSVAGTCSLVVFIIMETMRVLEVPPVSWLVRDSFQLLTDEQDKGPIILTHMYLLGGCVLPLWISQLNAAPVPLAAYAGVISLGVGDAIASVVGSALGSHRWQGTKKKKVPTATLR